MKEHTLVKDHSLPISRPSSGYISISLEEEGYVARQIASVDDTEITYRLRKKVFCDELNWLKSDNDFEIDVYDRSSVVPFGIYNKGHLEAYLRLLPTVNPFMLEEVFPMLIGPGHSLRKYHDTAEISRICIEPDARRHYIKNNYGVFSLSLLLYKSVYHWCILNKVRYLYIVVDVKLFRLLNMQGLICNRIGDMLLTRQLYGAIMPRKLLFRG